MKNLVNTIFFAIILTVACSGSADRYDSNTSTGTLACNWTADITFEQTEIDSIASIGGFNDRDFFLVGNKDHKGAVINFDGNVWHNIAIPDNIYVCTNVATAYLPCDVWITAMHFDDSPTLIRHCESGWDEMLNRPVAHVYSDIWANKYLGVYLITLTDNYEAELWQYGGESATWNKVDIPIAKDHFFPRRIWGPEDGKDIYVVGSHYDQNEVNGAVILHRNQKGIWKEQALPNGIKVVTDMHSDSVKNVYFTGLSEQGFGVTYIARNDLSQWDLVLDEEVDGNFAVRAMNPGTAIFVGASESESSQDSRTIKISTLDSRGPNVSLFDDTSSLPLRIWSSQGSNKAYIVTEDRIYSGDCR